MNRSLKTGVVVALLALLGIGGFALAGSLTPSGAVSATMHTLAEVYDSIAGTFDSTSVVADQNGSLMENLKYIEANIGGASLWASNSFGIYETTRNVGILDSDPAYALEIGTPGDINLASSGAGFRIGGEVVVSVKGIRNTWIGTGTGLLSTTDGTDNTALGYNALHDNIDGGENTALGIRTLASNSSGWDNVAIGAGALRSNTTGNSNIAIGFDALSANTTSNNNTAIGYWALRLNTGGSNTALGWLTLRSNTTGAENVAVGDQALASNVVGSYNTAIGKSALLANVGDSNTAIGRYALQSNSTGTQNVAVGAMAFATNTTGSSNTVLGYGAFSGATSSGDRNVAVGAEALFGNQTGSDNVAVGASAGYSFTGSGGTFIGSNAGYSTTGTNNTVVGYQALYSNGAGTNNTAVGYQAKYNSTAYYETAIGAQALYKTNSAGNYNSAVGYQALYNTDFGAQNSALGYQSLFSNTGGVNNSAVGANALYQNTNGQNNTAMGEIALFGNQTGNFNTGIGYSAGSSNSTGSNNTSVGAYALRFGGNGGYNIAVGASAGYSNTGSRNVFIGYSAGAQETGSNTLWIDNQSTASSSAFIYGELDKDWLSIGANASISGDLSVAGIASASKFEVAAGSISSASYGFGNGFTDMGMSRVGSTLLLQNKDTTPDAAGRSHLSLGDEFFQLGTVRAEDASNTGQLQCFDEGGSSMICRFDVIDGGGTGTTQFLSTRTDFGTNVSVSGNFETEGHAAIGTGAEINTGGYWSALAIPERNVLSVAETVTSLPNDENADGISNTLLVALTNPPISGYFVNAAENVAKILSSNTQDILQAIGATNWLLNESDKDVSTAYGMNAVVSNQGTSGTIANARGVYSAINNTAGLITDAYLLYADSPLGAGAYTNRYGLYVADQSSATVTNGWNIYSVGATSRNFFGGSASVSGNLEVAGYASLSVTYVDLTGTQSTHAVCHPSAGQAAHELLVDCDPTAGADYMEMYPMDSAVQEGEIVVPGPDTVTATDGSRVPVLIPSTTAYQNDILGITSVASQAGDFNSIGHNIPLDANPKPLALVGRVLLKVMGPVNAGDHLTSSDVPGIGIKATKPGMTVGVALQSTDTNGTILVFARPGYWAPETSGDTAAILDTGSDGFARLFGAIVEAFKKLLGITFEQGKVQADQICAGETCVNQAQLQELMERAHVTAPATTPEPTPTPSQAPEPTPEVTATGVPASSSGEFSPSASPSEELSPTPLTSEPPATTASSS